MAPQYIISHVDSGKILATQKSFKELKKCSFCKKSGHQAKCCPEIRCYFCGRYGHTQKLCWFKITNKLENFKRKMKQQMSQFNPRFNPSVSPTLNCNLSSGKPQSEFSISSQNELSFCSPPKSFCWNNLAVSRMPSFLIDNKNKLVPCSEKKSDTTKSETHESKVNSSDKDTKEKIINKINNNEKRINENNEVSPVDKEKLMRFPRVENFNVEDKFEDVICCDSELSPSIMDKKIEKHFDIGGMEFPHFLVLMQLLYDIRPPYYPKSHSSADDDEMYGIIKYIVKHYKCNVYLFQRDLGVETLFRPKNCKGKYNLFCLVDGTEYFPLLPYQEKLIGDIALRNEDNKVKENVVR